MNWAEIESMAAVHNRQEAVAHRRQLWQEQENAKKAAESVETLRIKAATCIKGNRDS